MKKRKGINYAFVFGVFLLIAALFFVAGWLGTSVNSSFTGDIVAQDS